MKRPSSPFLTPLTVCLASLAITAAAGQLWRDIVPTPKQAKPLGADWPLPEGAVIIADDFAKARIGAEEINGRIEELGAKLLPVTGEAAAAAPLVVRITCPPRFPDQVKRWQGTPPDVTADSPGPQGCVIAFAEVDGRREVLLAGSDEMGALYACVTFRWLLERAPEGLAVSRVAIRDWPDFKWRGSPSISFVASTAESSSSEAKTARVKRFVDWCLRRKINVIRDYAPYKPGHYPTTPVPWIAESNRYARERGFLTFHFTMTNIAYGKADPNNPLHKNCAMVNPRKLFTWADPAALKACTKELAQFCAANGLNLLGLHPPDGGGVMDPSQFSKRSDYDRQRWSDEQRAEADAHVFNMFYEAARKLQPDIRVGFTLYPYSPIYLEYERMKENNPDLTPELYERNVTGYYTKIAKLLPPDAHLVVREGQRPHLDKYRAYFGSRPLLTWCGFAARWHRQPYVANNLRLLGTSWYDAAGDVMSCMHTRVRPNLVNYLAAVEFMWNTKAPGAAPYEDFPQRLEYFTRPTEPRVLFEEFVPRACRNIWGPVAGPLIAPVFQHGLNPALVVRTDSVLGYVNERIGLEPDQYIRLTADMMAKQAEAAERALPGLEQIVRDKPAMALDAWRTAVYYYRRIRVLAVITRLRCHILRGTELADEDKDAEATAQAEAGIALYEREVPRLREMAEQTARLPHLIKKFKLRKRDAYSVVHKYDGDLDRYRKALAGLERRLLDKGKTLTPLQHDGPIRVGVYNGAADGGSAIGHDGVLLTFENNPDVTAQFVTDLSLANLIKYDCIFYPQGALGQSSTRYDFFTGLRRYVAEAGGAVWFMHDSVGSPRSQFGADTTFPEVAKGAKVREKSNKARVVKHPITRQIPPGTIIEHTYYDHWLVRRNHQAGRSVLMGEAGAVWVAGKVGQGRVLYDGTILLAPGSNAPAAATGTHEKLMTAALRWLTQRPSPPTDPNQPAK